MPVDLTQSPSSALPKHNLSTIISIVQELVNKIPELRKRLLKTKRGVFATDLTLVAYGIRTGYLVDLISPNDPVVVFSSLIGALRADPRTKDYFASVLHLYEPSSEQSFFVNTSLLALCLNQFHATGDEPTARGPSSHRVLIPFFILLQSPVKILDHTPSNVLQLLDSLLPLAAITEPPLSFSLPNDTPVEAAVPLAAILLDYPIAYVPSSSYSNVLSGIPLDFYECLLVFQSGTNQAGSSQLPEGQQSIMKFSCPTKFAHAITMGSWLYPQRVIQGLDCMFRERLERIGNCNMHIRIDHSTQTFGHVAF